MTRTERLLRLARLRGDRLAIAVLERPVTDHDFSMDGCPVKAPRDGMTYFCPAHVVDALGDGPEYLWSEAEMRAAWGDR